MVSLPCPAGWALLPQLYTPDGLNVFLARVFSVSYPGRVLNFLVIPWGSRIWFSSSVFLLYCYSFRMFSCSFFILLCYRYLLLWVLVFCKLWRLPGQPAEAKAQAYGACFESVRDFGKLFEGFQQIGRVRQGRVGRPRFSCRSYGLRPLPASLQCRRFLWARNLLGKAPCTTGYLPAVFSTVFEVGVCH